MVLKPCHCLCGDVFIFINLGDLLVATPKVAEKIAASKPKVLSLFDDDDAEEEDWFDNMKPSQT